MTQQKQFPNLESYILAVCGGLCTRMSLGGWLPIQTVYWSVAQLYPILSPCYNVPYIIHSVQQTSVSFFDLRIMVCKLRIISTNIALLKPVMLSTVVALLIASNMCPAFTLVNFTPLQEADMMLIGV